MANRDFKGVWIPKEIWLDKNLTLQEKCFLAEIDSLDNQEGCFAGNQYFSDFFGISKHRASQVISSLVNKKYITVYYQREGLEIVKRVLRICHEGVKNMSRRCLGSVKDNNTYNNTVNNTIIYKGIDFEQFWNLYDKKVGSKSKLEKKWKKLTIANQKAILEHIPKYKSVTPDKQYRKNPETYLNNQSWNDEIITKPGFVANGGLTTPDGELRGQLL